MIHLISHRGLNADVHNYHPESSEAAFRDQLGQGFGLEFDPQMTADRQLAVLHDPTLKRFTREVDTRPVSEVTLDEICGINFEGNRLLGLTELLELIKSVGNDQALHAIHVKAANQHAGFLDVLLDALKDTDPARFVLFDLKPEWARYLKDRNTHLHLAPSAAHPYDIERYNSAVGGTLISVEEACRHTDLFDWVWSNEWDRRDRDGGDKIFYNAEIFAKFRDHGLKIALVTPELHATSPGLLGGESHPDAATQDQLFARFVAIADLKPDAICTDCTQKWRALV